MRDRFGGAAVKTRHHTFDQGVGHHLADVLLSAVDGTDGLHQFVFTPVFEDVPLTPAFKHALDKARLVEHGQADHFYVGKSVGDDLKYPLAVWHYARGMAFAAKNQPEQASLELSAVKRLSEDATIEKITIWDINNCADLVDIAELVLEGELLFRQGQYEAAIPLLRQAIKIEDALSYNEPPDWFFSVRHHLGNVLLAAEKYAEAEALYRRDLQLFPETGFALNGLYESLRKQGKQKEAKAVKARFEKAWRWADVSLEGSLVKAPIQ